MNVARTTFRALFLDGGRIEIPAIQRDYAQGRDDEHSSEVRRRFLETLHSALTSSTTGSTPLDLDFVYGRRSDDRHTLEPLDGQQRLTTLFLLHWYLSNLDGAFEEFRSWISIPGQSSFSYRTRESAREFFDALVEKPVAVRGVPVVPEALSGHLTDAVWFVRSWLRDPTVRSSLRMLDAIHEKFSTSAGAWARLTAADPPAIIFRLLPLDDFDLSDELYVKMNARGKPLTPFEVFKAELEQFVSEALGNTEGPLEDGLGWHDYVAYHLDRTWLDFMWRHRDAAGEIDARFMHLVRGFAICRCLERTADGKLSAQIERLLSTSSPSVPTYKAIGCLDADFVDNLTLLLDTLSSADVAAFVGEDSYVDEARLFRRVLMARGANETEGLTLVDWVLFYAWCAFLLRYWKELKTPACRDAFHDWFRLIANLARNSEIDRNERLIAALMATRRLAEHASPALLSQAASGALDEAGGFNQQQRREERLKAQLLLRSPGWRPLLERAERHGYFLGDIGFLLQFSGVLGRASALGGCTWEDSEDSSLQTAFADWYARATAVFPETGEGVAGFPNFLWERALLTVGNFMLPRGKNMSFLEARGGEATWKRLLRADTKVLDKEARRDVVRQVLERVDAADGAGSLNRIVAEVVSMDNSPESYLRSRLVAEPDLLAYCRSREIRYEDGTVYLLSKIQRNGRHVDAYLYDLYLQLARRPKDLAPLGCLGLVEPTDSYVSSTVRLDSWLLGPTLQVTRDGNGFLLRAAPGTHAQPLAEHFPKWSPSADGGIRLHVALDRAEDEVVAFAAHLGEVRHHLLVHPANPPR
jgi:hypothetical protein